jgi:hypothetical protein
VDLGIGVSAAIRQDGQREIKVRRQPQRGEDNAAGGYPTEHEGVDVE